MKKFLLLTTLLCGWMGSAMAADEANYITVKDASTSAGTVAVNVELFNSSDFKPVAFQCDIVLPEGVTLDEESLVVVKDRCYDHTIASNVLSDGTFRMVCYSMKNTVITGTEGVVATFNAAINEVGTYTFTVKNVVIADAESVSKKPETNKTGDITINPADKKKGDINGNGVVDNIDLAILIDYILGNATGYSSEEVDVTGNGIVDNLDLNEMVNIILGN